MAEGVDTLSNSLENISLSSSPEERNALEAALNLPEDHAMIPDDMVKKMKRRGRKSEDRKTARSVGRRKSEQKKTARRPVTKTNATEENVKKQTPTKNDESTTRDMGHKKNMTAPENGEQRKSRVLDRTAPRSAE